MSKEKNDKLDECGVNLKAKNAVKKLKAYTYPYDKKMICPIAIMGPTGIEGDTKLRVYAFGGEIGRIATKKLEHCTLKLGRDYKKASNDDNDKDNKKVKDYAYGKYLIDGYENGHLHKFTYEQIHKQIEYVKTKHNCDNLYVEFDRLHKSYKKQQQKYDAMCGDDQQKYLDIICTAAYTRFQHREGEKDNTKVIDLSERSCQTLIAHVNQNTKWEEGKDSLVVVDMEYDVPLNAIIEKDGKEKFRMKKDFKTQEEVHKKKAKVDFVVFDGKSFGLIEFKYQAMSMEAGSENSLKEHYLDFKRIIDEDMPAEKIKLIKELIRRMEYLLDYEVIDKSWKASFEKLKEKVASMSDGDNYDSDLLWCGFYFVHDKKYEDKVKVELKNQLGKLAADDSFRAVLQIENEKNNYKMLLNAPLR